MLNTFPNDSLVGKTIKAVGRVYGVDIYLLFSPIRRSCHLRLVIWKILAQICKSKF